MAIFHPVVYLNDIFLTVLLSFQTDFPREGAGFNPLTSSPNPLSCLRRNLLSLSFDIEETRAEAIAMAKLSLGTILHTGNESRRYPTSAYF
jgi:hypothetical protein